MEHAITDALGLSEADLISRIEGAQGQRPRGLPGAIYTSRDFLRLEYDAYFRRSWLFVGLAHDIPDKGDAVPVLGLPIFLCRDGEGAVRAFHNVCRHRGHAIVQKKCTRRRFFVCPYHAWAYGLDGRLLRTPYFDGADPKAKPTLDTESFGLKEIRCEVWHDWVFVNLEANADALSDHIAPLARAFADFDLSQLKLMGEYETGPHPVNWKVIYENAIESYHEPFCHPEFVVHTPLGLHEELVDGDLVGNSVRVGDREGVTWQAGYDTDSHYYGLMPNFFVAFSENGIVNVHLIVPDPEDPCKTWRKVVGYLISEEAPSEEDRATWLEHSKKLNIDQDQPLWEPIQRGYGSPFYEETAVFSTAWEKAVIGFQSRLLQRIEGGIAARRANQQEGDGFPT